MDFFLKEKVFFFLKVVKVAKKSKLFTILKPGQAQVVVFNCSAEFQTMDLKFVETAYRGVQ